MDFWFSLCSLFLYSSTGFFLSEQPCHCKNYFPCWLINWSFCSILHYFNILLSLFYIFLFIWRFPFFPEEWKYKFVLCFGMRISSLLKQIWFPGLLFLIELKQRNCSCWGRGGCWRVEFRTMLFICFVFLLVIFDVLMEFSKVKLDNL